MYICASQSLFSHSYVVNEWLNRHCNVQIDIGIRADELGIKQPKLKDRFRHVAMYVPDRHMFQTALLTVKSKLKSSHFKGWPWKFNLLLHLTILVTLKITNYYFTKVGVLRDSHYLFSTPYREFEWFFGAKKKKNCASRFESKKAAMGDEGLSVASHLVAPQLYRNGL
jgi:hypothetical protein